MVKEKSGLEITVPDPGFTVTDVRDWVGPKRVVDIMDCATQKNSEMTMKEWDEYYYSENRTRKLMSSVWNSLIPKWKHLFRVQKL